MPATIKTPEEIEKMRIAGRLAGDVLQMIRPHVQPGITTNELDRICHDYIVDVQQAIPAPLNYRGFPKSICTSVNHVVCHGIPSDKVLKRGDALGALIEARSCERFARLAPRLPERLARFYGGLLASESRHFEHYLGFALTESGVSQTELDERLAELKVIEAELITAPDPRFRFHSGPPAAE